MPTSPQVKYVLRFQEVLTYFGKRADEDLKIALDNPVEAIKSDLNNFIQLEKAPSRQYRIGESNLSKFEAAKIFEKSILAKSVPFCIIGKGEDDYYLLWYGALESTK